MTCANPEPISAVQERECHERQHVVFIVDNVCKGSHLSVVS